GASAPRQKAPPVAPPPVVVQPAAKPPSPPPVPAARPLAPAPVPAARPQTPAPATVADVPAEASAEKEPGKPIRRVGLLFPSEGPRKGFGVEARRGAQLCMEDPRGERPFALEAVVREENGADPAAVITELVDSEGVVAIVGPLLSGAAGKAIAAAERRALPLISPTAGAAGLGEGSTVFFRTCLTLEAFAAALAEYAVGRLGAPNVAILLPAQPYGRSLAGAFRQALEARGARVPVVREYPPGLRDLVPWSAALVKELLPDGAEGAPAVDAIFLAGSAVEAGMILPRLAYLGLDPREVAVLGGSALDVPEFPRLAGGYAEGALIADGFFAGSDQPAAADFVQRYRERHGDDPGPAAAQACAAVELLAAALRGGAATPRGTLDALGALGEVPTVLGPVRVAPGGRIERRPFFITVRAGGLVELGGR
ncbi:MAG TPA: ABC transporter substrate-binding protein, partial [bacterium]